ncbi:LysM peptidoglycan-binding domain-containing protein (plasmid) [Streptomyces sp. NBC_00053]|uniref:LysM peptidoglycan-binding domain-containing protein n=1 Tax=unclassified Streptomyces TaxID=2593676 RepID=UPI00225174E6|nr:MULTISPECIES: LysM peptidoglycan-binding domain-containing protein [unclassified Streptomyces]MCX4399961.1 LysM peptidoglycan-binding domain-containing protein [Streptomyces sp. NBC_01767]MCX5506035.1 LysM peptidoglycan-binding domain-containing protein [Streptomyces sp. NBC_00052]MCX5554310.1 LysM peptidoglycan-binding domain-containing protein [Streptomyces sp. NBC_00051]WSP52938.1 LysM peptidoglycan-binding domain-containing protein [Streptomyces sp. NBC_01243]
MPPTNRRATSWPRALARGLFALVFLVLLVAGIPVLLLDIGTLPRSVPDVGSWQDVLQFHDDDGTALMTAMTAVAWVLWLWLTVPVVIETIAVLARRTTPRLPGMGTGQKLAGFLLGSIILASPATASATTPAAAATAQALPAQTIGADAASTTGTKAGAAEQTRQPGRITVSQDATWWELSEQLLGDGAHFEQLQRLNPDLAPSDGVITTGTTLRVPAHAARPAAQTSANNPQPHTATAPQAKHGAGTSQYRVKSGDNLWDIAHKELGNPTRYPEIVQANPDVIDDPDLIYPGERLSIPDQTAGPEPAPPREHASGSQEEDHRDQEDGAAPSESPRASDGEAGTPEQEASPAPSASTDGSAREERSSSPAHKKPSKTPDTGAPSRTAPAEEPAGASAQKPSAPDASAPSAGSAPPADEQHSSAQSAAQDQEAGPSVTVLALGAGGFAAAGVLLMLRRKRTLQQRRRRPGRRIAMPSGRAAATERTLRCVDAIEEVGFLDAALRTLAHHCAEAERPLPALGAVQLGTEGILLHLTNDVGETGDGDFPAPLPPFTATEDSPQVWWCPVDTSDLLAAELRGQMEAPYPALIALGDDTHEALLLVDLERFGAVHLTGETRLPVLRALGTSLAVSPLSSDLEIAVAGEDSAPGLSLIDPRVTPYTTLADAADVVRTHHSRQHSTLSDSDSADLGAARAADTVDELWPMIVLADLDSCPDPESAEQLAQVLQQEPRTATAIITSGHAPADDAEAVWVLDTDDEAHLVPGTSLQCRLVAFSDEEYADVVESALTSSSETDVAPDPTPPPPTAPAENSPVGPAASAAAGPQPGARKSGSLLASLAELDHDSPASGPTPSDQGASVPAEEGHGDGTATKAEPPSSLPAAAETARPSAPQTDAAPPSRIVLPATTPVTRVNARLPAPVSPPAPDRPEPAPADTDNNSAPGPSDKNTADAPTVRVLGPVDVTGARGHIESNRRTVAMELTCWLALRTDGATRHELDEVIAPGGGRVENNTRNGRIREVRRWLGEDKTGEPYYPKLNTQADRKHRLAGVACDWHQFQDLVAQAAGHDGDQARALLRRALELVRGRPFTGIPPRRYVWAENLAQDMISTVVDAADDLAARCLTDGDAQGALWAAGRGLETGREREVLWRHRFEALAQLGAHTELEAAIQQLNQYLLEADLPMEPETEQTIRRLDAVRH